MIMMCPHAAASPRSRRLHRPRSPPCAGRRSPCARWPPSLAIPPRRPLPLRRWPRRWRLACGESGMPAGPRPLRPMPGPGAGRWPRSGRWPSCPQGWPPRGASARRSRNTAAARRNWGRTDIRDTANLLAWPAARQPPSQHGHPASATRLRRRQSGRAAAARTSRHRLADRRAARCPCAPLRRGTVAAAAAAGFVVAMRRVRGRGRHPSVRRRRCPNCFRRRRCPPRGRPWARRTNDARAGAPPRQRRARACGRRPAGACGAYATRAPPRVAAWCRRARAAGTAAVRRRRCSRRRCPTSRRRPGRSAARTAASTPRWRAE